jgi:thioredoxin-related protein
MMKRAAAWLFGILLGAMVAGYAHAAELIMFERAGCPWCEAFDREIAPVYPKTATGQFAPLRRVNIHQTLPPDLSFIVVERLTPLFVLVDNGREIGRIRGYPGESHFWGLLDAMVERLQDKGVAKAANNPT